MSRDGGAARGGGRDGAGNVASQPFPPQFYPIVGYQGPPHAWFPPHPSTGAPAQWGPSWRPPMGYSAPTPPWPAQHPSSTANSTNTKDAAPSDEYTVDTLRRIYKDDDGRVEIQRVKVHRRHPEPGGGAGAGAGAVSLPGPEAMSVVPVGNFPLNERRPPPRKNRRKQQIQINAPGPAGTYPWYPYMPYMPYPYPYPYYFGGCMWAPGAPSASVSAWSGNDESERAPSQQDSVPATLESQRLDSRSSHFSRDSFSPVLHRSSSPAAVSQITDIHSIAPSDSVSVRGRKRETSLERALRGPTPPPRTRSRASSSLDYKSGNTGKTQEWMLEMQRALGTTSGGVITEVTDITPSPTHPPDVVIYKKIPPVRKRRKMKIDGMSDKSSVIDLKDVDDVSERQSVASDATFDEPSRISSELNYAFRKLERSVDAFKTELRAESPPLHSPAASPSVEIIHSSGDTTPTEAHTGGPPLSDISGLADKAREHDAEEFEKYKRPEDISQGSISSLPSLETARTTFALDALHTKSTPVASFQPQKSTLVTEACTSTTSTAPAAGVAPSAQPTQSSAEQEQHADAPSALLSSTEETERTAPVSEATPQRAVSSEVEVSPTATTEPPCQPSGQAFQPSSKSQPPQVPETTTGTTATEMGTLKGASESERQPVTIKTAVSIETSTEKTTAATVTGGAAPRAGVVAGAGAGAGEADGRDSRASSSTFFSTRPSDDPHALDTDSTDIPLPTTADEGEDTPASSGPEDGYQWVLQQPGEAPTLNTTHPAGQDERRNTWRAEVSLWRARLVVSLCRGRGLDRQDWATFHLMVHHPLTLDLKLSLLHAPRLCAANSNTGAALVRVALIRLAQYGETLLQPEASRQPGWRSIKVDPGQAWAPVTGAVEILRSLGYREGEDGCGELRYRRRSGPEASVLARLTLDMLVLAEELRLYLTGTHQYPKNVSDLFFPGSPAESTTPDLPNRPPSSAGSFVSALSEATPITKPENGASSVTDDNTETMQASVTEFKNQTNKYRQKSSSEEDITLKDDITTVATKTDTMKASEAPKEASTLAGAPTNPEAQHEGSSAPLPTPATPVTPATPASDTTSLSSDITSLPDLQSIRSSTTSQASQRLSGSEASGSNDTVTPVATPTPAPVTNSAAQPTEAKVGDTPLPAPETTHDNPEDHVYEEIDVIRAQVQALRASSVPTESAPPPLPPKKKVAGGGEDDSALSLTYPHVEWSTASMPGSLRGGSTGARRKKRRAPMPPEFMPPDWKQSQDKLKEKNEQTSQVKDAKETDNKKKAEYRRSLNPFYEEIDSVQDKVKELEGKDSAKHNDTTLTSTENGNPFLENQVKPSGYIGKNPFYEDVDITKKNEQCKESNTSQPALPTPDGEAVCAMGSLSELQTDAVAVRPKRRAPRPPPTPESLKKLSTSQATNLPKEPASAPAPVPAPAPAPAPAPPLTTPADQSKGGGSSDQELKVKGTSSGPCEEVGGRGEGEAGSPGKLEAAQQEKDQPTGSEKLKGVDSDHGNNLKKQEAQNDMSIKSIKTEAFLPTSTPSQPATATGSSPREDEKQEPVRKEAQEVETNKEATQDKSPDAASSRDPHRGREAAEAARQATPQLNRAAQQRVSLPHPKTPPPPPPSSTSPAATLTHDASAPPPTEDSPPPVLPPKAPLSLLEEIPYMDANEVRYAKAQKMHSSPRLEIRTPRIVPSLTGSIGTPPATARQHSLVLGEASNVPFIDDSDLPPDCPPPLPPSSPPESPPETPHTSPPETPHTSPPVTPRPSPRHSPRSVPRYPPLDSVNTINVTSGQKAEREADTPPPVPPKISQLTSLTPGDPAHSPPHTQPEVSTQDATNSPPPKNNPQTPPPEPPAASQNTHDPLTGTHSVQSSVSEERYEIPDTSRAPPPRPPIPTPTKTPQSQTNDTTYTPPSESDRYEVPEAPKTPAETKKGSREALKTPEAEERYEIPEVVKEAPMKRGANGTPCTVALGRTSSPRRGEIAAVFGPPKPPRRRRNNQSPPPRPPKNPALMDGAALAAQTGAAARPPSTSSFSSSSRGTTSSGLTTTSNPPHHNKKSPKRRSWPFLLCDCLYVNCRTYDDANEK